MLELKRILINFFSILSLNTDLKNKHYICGDQSGNIVVGEIFSYKILYKELIEGILDLCHI